MSRSSDEYIHSLINTSGGPDACHPWTGYTAGGGYGLVHLSRVGRIPVHRWAMEQLLGRPLEPTEIICHHCDNPPCCNVRHLYVGTHSTNARDREARGRGYTAKRVRAAACCNGHEFTDANTYTGVAGKRGCRACNAAAQRRLKARRLAAAS